MSVYQVVIILMDSLVVLLAAVLFLVVSSPLVYNIVQKLFGGLFTVAVDGKPTPAGLVLHTIVFALLFSLVLFAQKM